MHYSEGDLVLKQVPPSLGQHTEEVMSGLLSMSIQEIQTLREQGVIE